MSMGKSLRGSLFVGAATAVLSFINFGVALSAPLALKDEPLFLNEVPPPLNMLVMSRDHRMYYEAYNDASDLDSDGVLDITYKPDAKFAYYGYFDSYRCYSYSGGVFRPQGATSNKKCSGQWSGDWLNYVTMSRMDALRKVLYGGLRSVDTNGQTILQRAFIPQDAHSWGKEYTSFAVNGYDISEFTPLGQPAAGRRHLFANTTPSADGLEYGSANPAANGVALPKMRVLESYNGRIWDWVSKERPVADAGFAGGIVDYVVRVEVCGTGTFESDPATNCKLYGSGKAKPTGLLQDYGENDSMYFGLLSGSYGRPHDGGVLRKAVGSLKDEVDLATGRFVYNLPSPGVIGTIDRLRITNFNNDTYGCGWIADSSDAAGKCSMWGNPTAEMMYEVARYFSGKGNATADFESGAGIAEETGIGLKIADWNQDTDPYKSFPHCAKPFETVISDISPSYDSDKVPGSMSGYSGDIPMNASSLGQTIWTHEMGGSGKFFIGQSGAIYDGAPTVKNVTSFGNIRGLAPEGPTKEGSYNSGSVAYYSLTNDLNSVTGDQKMQTFAVALASPLPRIEIPVGNGKISFVPFAKSVGGYGIDAAQGSYQPTNQIVDFYVDTLTPTYGKFRVNFEDVEQGADHDMDAIALYEYQVNSNGTVTITVTSEYAAGSITQHMGYVISGSSQDGTYLVVRDIPEGNNPVNDPDPDYFLDTPPGQPPGGNWKDGVTLPYGFGKPTARSFSPGSTASAGVLKDPLYYAAKWGGFDDTKGNSNGFPDQSAEWDANGDGVPDNYFLVTNALKLKQQLAQAFSSILDKSAAASAASVSSGSINENTRIFQATFDARYWGGHLNALPVGTGAGGTVEGAIGASLWDAANKLPAPNGRKIFTVNPTGTGAATGVFKQAIPFQWGTLGTVRQAQLDRGDGHGEDRLDWLRGDRSDEAPSGIKLRKRGTYTLGDIVNSSPVYIGVPTQRYPDNLEAKPYSAFRSANLTRAQTVYVGANDGMLHAFDADSGIERFAFVPHSVFDKLYSLPDPAYAHVYSVDGTPTVIDAFYGGDWHTVLTSGLNKGGQGVFALDVTNPAFSSEADAKNSFLWEFTDAKDADLGYSYSRPSIVRLHNGKWAAIFGNGYNNTDASGGADTHVSTTGNAALFIVDIQTGELIKKIDVGVGMAQDPLMQSRPNGLATAAVIDLNGDRTADYVYAGDLFGNMWKFNITSSDPTFWDVAYRPGGVATPLFKAVNSSGVAQPITERPQVSVGPRGVGAVVLFGTGKFLEAKDRNVAQLSVQSFYGIYDRMSGSATTDVVPSNRSTLVQQTILGEVSGTINGKSVDVRASSENAVDPATKGGWYIDLRSPNGFQGEMQVSDAVIREGRVLFTTLIPDPDVCAFGGRSWFMNLSAITGSRSTFSPFDLNNDKVYSSADFIRVNINGTPVDVAASGFAADAILARVGLVTGNSVVSGDDKGDAAPGTTGGTNGDTSTAGGTKAVRRA
jgi:type IV pilus assembly protein PilY1